MRYVTMCVALTGWITTEVSSAWACALTCAVAFLPGPLSWVEVAITVPVALTVLGVLVQAVRYTLWPGEATREHIKSRILQEE